MRAELASLYHCAVPFLSRAAANLRRYFYISLKLQLSSKGNMFKFPQSLKDFDYEYFL